MEYALPSTTDMRSRYDELLRSQEIQANANNLHSQPLAKRPDAGQYDLGKFYNGSLGVPAGQAVPNEWSYKNAQLRLIQGKNELIALQNPAKYKIDRYLKEVAITEHSKSLFEKQYSHLLNMGISPDQAENMASSLADNYYKINMASLQAVMPDKLTEAISGMGDQHNQYVRKALGL